MSDKLKKYVIETASDNSEAVFILSTKRPKFRAKIHIFETFKDFIRFDTSNITKQVAKQPILLEVIEIEPDYNQNQFDRSLERMAQWYYYNHIKNDTI